MQRANRTAGVLGAGARPGRLLVARTRRYRQTGRSGEDGERGDDARPDRQLERQAFPTWLFLSQHG
jgi:hypothetical protein